MKLSGRLLKYGVVGGEWGSTEADVALIDTDEVILQARKRAELRKMLVALGLEAPDLPALKALVTRCPDVDLAFTALTMLPRPTWVHDLVGP